MFRSRVALFFLALLITCSVSCGSTQIVSPIVLPSGLEYTDWTVGSGAVADTGATVTIDYTIWLLDGKKIVSSYDMGAPLHFTLGVGHVIPGFDQGIAGMRVGGIRTLIIPADLAYGARGFPGSIPPNSALKSNIHLLQVQ
jgi:FKBP-type peptidyl-prolyl cis-trans isomerase FkpA